MVQCMPRISHLPFTGRDKEPNLGDDNLYGFYVNVGISRSQKPRDEEFSHSECLKLRPMIV